MKSSEFVFIVHLCGLKIMRFKTESNSNTAAVKSFLKWFAQHSYDDVLYDVDGFIIIPGGKRVKIFDRTFGLN